MGTEPKIVRYALYNRIELALGFAMVAFFLFGAAYFAWRLPWSEGRSEPFVLASRLLMAVMALAAAVVSTAYQRAIWFLAYVYSYSDSWLEAYDPVLRRRSRIEFSEVSRIESAYVPVGHAWQRNIRRIHTLETDNGSAIRISEGLSCWPEIKSRCCNAEYQKLDSKFFGVKE